MRSEFKEDKTFKPYGIIKQKQKPIEDKESIHVCVVHDRFEDVRDDTLLSSKENFNDTYMEDSYRQGPYILEGFIHYEEYGAPITLISGRSHYFVSRKDPRFMMQCYMGSPEKNISPAGNCIVRRPYEQYLHIEYRFTSDHWREGKQYDDKIVKLIDSMIIK